MADLSSVVQLGKRIGTEFSEKNATLIAAGIAYNAFISLAPILFVLLVAVSLAGGGLEQRIVEVAQRSLPGPIAGIVAQIFQGDSEASGASAVGLVILLWGALKIFRSLDTAFEEIYETTADNSFVDQLIDALVVLVAIVLAIIGTVGVTAVFAILENTIPFIGFLTPVALIGGLIIAFFPMYYHFPNADMHWKHVLPGVMVAAIGWAVFQSLFQVYLAATGGGSQNFFGGVIVIVTWLYFSGLILLLGAIINAVLGGYASGEAGGVGQGAAESKTDAEPRYEATLTRSEFADFLKGLREELTGRYEEMRPTGRTEGPDQRPQPAGDIDVVERATINDDTQEWTISLRWRTTADESDGHPDSAGD